MTTDCLDCHCPGDGKCSHCYGTGEDPSFIPQIGGVPPEDCEYCGGSGECQTCDGTGTAPSE